MDWLVAKLCVGCLLATLSYLVGNHNHDPQRVCLNYIPNLINEMKIVTFSNSTLDLITLCVHCVVCLMLFDVILSRIHGPQPLTCMSFWYNSLVTEFIHFSYLSLFLIKLCSFVKCIFPSLIFTFLTRLQGLVFMLLTSQGYSTCWEFLGLLSHIGEN